MIDKCAQLQLTKTHFSIVVTYGSRQTLYKLSVWYNKAQVKEQSRKQVARFLRAEKI